MTIITYSLARDVHYPQRGLEHTDLPVTVQNNLTLISNLVFIHAFMYVFMQM